MYLALTGFRLRGEDVTKAGIATHYIGSDKLAEVEDRLAAIDAPSKATVASVLDEYDMRSAGPPSWAPEVESIDRCFGGDSVEAIVASLEDDGSEWAAKQIKTLGKMSPTSLKLTHEQLTRGKQMSLEECFMMEYRLTQGCMRGVDFYEGIRAVLIEKDHSPVWNPSSLDAVSTLFSGIFLVRRAAAALTCHRFTDCYVASLCHYVYFQRVFFTGHYRCSSRPLHPC